MTKQDPPPEDEVPEPGDTVITLNADGVPIIYTEPEPKKGKGSGGRNVGPQRTRRTR
jgi:hypothetical protein